MTTSRRGFLRLGAGVATAVGVQWRAPEILSARAFEDAQSQLGRGPIRLDHNENAYGFSFKVDESIKASIPRSNRYARPQYAALAEHVAQVHKVKPEQVLLGCGSTEILRAAAFAFLGNGKRLIQASPTYQALERYTRSAGCEVVPVNLTARYAHDLDSILARADASTTLVYICNPNNPTATLTPRADLEIFISKLPASTFVVIDEAYHHYAGTSAMYASFIDRPVNDERVIVIRTFSKVYGLAGLRLGYAVGSPRVLQKMAAFMTENNINSVVTDAAAVALDDIGWVSDSIRRNADDRQEFFNQAMARAYKPIDSQTNFVMMNTYHPAKDLVEHFRKNNILIGPVFPAMDTYIRVSLGRPAEMQAFWRAWDMVPYLKNAMHH